MLSKRPFVQNSLHIFVLFGFAAAQPLFSVLSVYPEFFVARQSHSSDPVWFAVILCLGVPSLLVLFEGAVRAFGAQLYAYLHAGLVWILASAVCMQLLNATEAAPGRVLTGVALLLAAAATVVYWRFDEVRTYLTVLSPAVLVFPGVFFLSPGINKVVFPEPVEAELRAVESTTPIVMVVLDELPLSSIMDESRRIDLVRFPNLARFAGDSHWFRNATTVSDDTLLSVPAILSGSRPHPKDSRLATIGDYPDNLFTLLKGSHSLHVVENATQLSPEEDVRESWAKRMVGLLSDSATVYVHVLLPADMTSGLPAINRGWKEFVNIVGEVSETKFGEGFHPDMGASRISNFREFVDSIQAEEQPTLSFIHTLLPHMPWQYLPNGKQYMLRDRALPGLVGTGFLRWSDDHPLVIQAYQRHILQAGFVDKLIGELVDRLKQADLYEPSLIVITADHGISFRSNEFIRKLTETNHPDIMWIPLFIKEPHQDSGSIIDRNVETIDILPTIADVLDIELPWATDGVSALDPTLGERSRKTALVGKAEELVFGSRLDPLDDSLKRKVELLGSGPWESLFAYGPYAGVVGRSVHDFQVYDGPVGVDLEGEALFDDVDLDAAFLPARISGLIRATPSNAGSQYLAISVNDRIQAVTEWYGRPNNARGFSAMVPDTAVLQGKNDLEVFRVLDRDGHVRLERLPGETRPGYVLTGSEESGGETLEASDGPSTPVVTIPDSGWVRMEANEETGIISIMGWALDLKQPAKDVTVVVFQHGRLLHSGVPGDKRPDVAEIFPAFELGTPGFGFDLPLAKFDRDMKVRVFVLLNDGTASELAYVRDGWVFPLDTP